MAKARAANRGGGDAGSVKAAVKAIRQILPSAGGDRTLAFWKVGEEMEGLRNQGVSPGAALKKAGVSERESRYCQEVYRVFTDYAQLEELVAKGMRWSTVRELAGDRLKSRREGLIRRFQSGKLKNAQVLAKAIGIRTGRSGLGQAAAQVIARCGKLQVSLGEARKAIREAADTGGSRTEGDLRQVEAMLAALSTLAGEAKAVAGKAADLAGGARAHPRRRG